MPNRKTYKEKHKKDMTDEQYNKFMANRSPRIIERAMRLLHGERFDVEKNFKTAIGKLVSESGAGAAWDIVHRASETLAEYLRLADDVESRRPKSSSPMRGPVANPKAWRGGRTGSPLTARCLNWDFPRHPSPEKRGYMDLPRELVVALVGAGLMWGGQYRTAKDIVRLTCGRVRSSTGRRECLRRFECTRLS